MMGLREGERQETQTTRGPIIGHENGLSSIF